MFEMAIGRVKPGRNEPVSGADDARVDFGVEFRASFPLLWRIAAGIVGDASLADDIVQESAVVAIGKLNRFKAGTSFTAWMGRIVRYVAMNHARTRQKRRADESGASAIENMADFRAPDRAGSGGDCSRAMGTGGGAGFDLAIRAALAEVGDVARACLLLRTLDGLKYSEIAALLGIPEGTAMSHVHRSRKRLRRCLAQTGPGASRAKGSSG